MFRLLSCLLLLACVACGALPLSPVPMEMPRPETAVVAAEPAAHPPADLTGAGGAGYATPPPMILALRPDPTPPTLDLYSFSTTSGRVAGPSEGASQLSWSAMTSAAPEPEAMTGTTEDFYGGWTEYWGAAGEVSFYQFFDADFRLADSREEWDEVDRFEITFHSREPLHGHVEALIGAFFYYEERDWDDGLARILFDSWGFGVDLGAMLYPYVHAEERNFNIGLHPFARFAFGWNDGDFRNIDKSLPGQPGLASGELDNLRFDFGLGAEVRAVIGRSFFFGLGAGWNWWTTANGATGFTSNTGGTIIIFDDEYDFRGNEGWTRVTLGFYF